MGIAEVDLDSGLDPKPGVGRQLVALIPGQRARQMGGQLGDSLLERRGHVLGRAVGAEPRQHHVAGLALDQRGDERAPALADQKIALPVTRNGPVGDLGRAL